MAQSKSSGLGGRLLGGVCLVVVLTWPRHPVERRMDLVTVGWSSSELVRALLRIWAANSFGGVLGGRSSPIAHAILIRFRCRGELRW